MRKAGGIRLRCCGAVACSVAGRVGGISGVFCVCPCVVQCLSGGAGVACATLVVAHPLCPFLFIALFAGRVSASRRGMGVRVTRAVLTLVCTGEVMRWLGSGLVEVGLEGRLCKSYFVLELGGWFGGPV